MLSTGGALAPRHMAALALAAHAKGVSLPGGRFVTPKDTLSKQWNTYIAQQCGSDDPLCMHLEIEVDEDKVTAAFSAMNSLSVLRLKPIVQRLNRAHEGLGWLVYDIVAQAGHSLPMYDPSRLGDIAQHLWFYGYWSDEDVLEEIRCMDESLEDKSMEEIRKSFTHPFPSDLIASVDGHGWMLGAYDFDPKRRKPRFKKPKACSLDTAAAFASGRSRSALKQLVADALELRKDLQRKKPHAWHEEFEPKASDLSEYLDEDSYIPRIGATCFVVWDKSYTTIDAANHYEEYEMNGGEGTDVFYLLKADPTQPGEVDRFVSRMQEIIRRYALVSRLLRHFPKEE